MYEIFSSYGLCISWWFTNWQSAFAQDCKYEKTVVLDDGGKFYPLKQNMFVKGLNLF